MYAMLCSMEVKEHDMIRIEKNDGCVMVIKWMYNVKPKSKKQLKI